MSTNSIIAELHAIRREYAERFNQDLHAIGVDAHRKQGRQAQRVVVSIPKASIGCRTQSEDARPDNRSMANGR